MRRKIDSCILLLFIILSSFLLPRYYNYSSSNIIRKNEQSTDSDNNILKMANENNNRSNLIIFFNSSSFNEEIMDNFNNYGGWVNNKRIWNNTFSSISGFAGNLPDVNISAFRSNWKGVNIENDEIIQTQMNFITLQTGAANISNYLEGYMGNTNSSIAVLDTGIDVNHDFFPNGYDSTNLNGDIVGWQDFINDELIPSDTNGHGTFISSVMTGTGKQPFNSTDPTIVNLFGNYSHSELFDDSGEPGNFTLKIFSFNTSIMDSNIFINSSWNFQVPEIDNFWIELYYNKTELVAYNHSINPNEWYTINYTSTKKGQALYDLYIKYHRKDNSFPVFSFNTSVSFYPEFYIEDYAYFTGIANMTKLVSYKILNQTGLGYTSDLISALDSIIDNRSKFHIISVCLSIGTSSGDFIATNRVIDEVIENGIIIVIAAGNYGPNDSNHLNKLASNKKAIVVGAINDEDQVTSYSSRGKDLGNGVIKPDILAPGGSKLPGHRLVIGADSKSKELTAAYGTSIASAIVAASVNLLIEAKWNNWSQWDSLNSLERNEIIKSILLMTCSETNLEREDDPLTDELDEGLFSPTNFYGISSSLKDQHEGYGRLNIQAAIDALTKYAKVSEIQEDYLISSREDPLGNHVFARRINFVANTQYLVNLTDLEEDADFDVFLFSNQSNQYGEPILLGASRKITGDSNFFYFIPKENQTECIVIVKAIDGNSTFKLNITTVENDYIPELNIPLVESLIGEISKNTTVMSYEEFVFGEVPYQNYTTGNYYFLINYTDKDTSNVPPQEVYVSITELGRNYTMRQLNLFDDNYTDGALFISEQVQFSIPDTYHYFFIASDGNKVKYPHTGELNVTIDYPTKIEIIPYNHSFNEGLDNWYYTGTGWELLNQSNQNDDRSGIFLEGTWKSMYFGYYQNHNYPLNYTYQPMYYGEDFPNGTLYSPIFNLSGLSEYFNPIVKFGLRISINNLDFINLQINVNWSGWDTIESYTNMEEEWFLEELNMSEYKASLIQFRFVSALDDLYDSIKNKGFVIDYFSFENYSNNQSPIIYFDLNSDISPLAGSKFQKFTFSCKYYDSDNNYPEFAYIEISDEDQHLQNYSMYNKYGKWLSNNGIGIEFSNSLILGSIFNRSFRFHVSDGIYINSTSWYNKDNSQIDFLNPKPLQYNVYKSMKMIGYDFSNDNLNDYYIAGIPIQGQITAWLTGDNTWHSIYHRGLQKDILYAGIGQRTGVRIGQGYGKDWNSKLITLPLKVLNDYPIYLQFTQNISLQNEVFYNKTDYDECRISISTDYGNNWHLLKNYNYDSTNLAGDVAIDLSKYANDIVMIMFTFYSNNYEPSLLIPGAIGDGWFLYDIYIGYDKSTDVIAPTIDIQKPKKNQIIHSIFEIEVTITDNIGVDRSRIALYINDDSISKEDFDYNKESGILDYKWDTLQYEDGEYEIKVIAYDNERNRVEESIKVIVNNSFLYWLNLTITGSEESKPEIWNIIIPITILITFPVIIGYIVYIRKKRKNLWVQISKRRVIGDIKTKKIDREQILKKIKLLEPEEELKGPIILHCKFCQAWFYQQESKFDIMCPVCDHDQIYAAYNCMNCGKWIFKDEPKEDYFCPKCASYEGIKHDRKKKFKRFHRKEKIINEKESVRLIRREKSEIEEILANEGKILREFKLKKKGKLDILNL